ncbi:hypothetical protein MMC25_001138 [Agyrium rufum]|nr:hypothetical protein [Agyrium rufum]
MTTILPTLTDRDFFDPQWHLKRQILSHDGDVELVVGQLDPVHLVVSSGVLSDASTVWKAMFSVRFREGQALQQHRSRQDGRTSTLSSPDALRIALPDDHQSGMLFIGRALHAPAEAEKILPSYKTLEAIVSLCDKYDFGSALREATSVWLRAFMAEVGKPGRERLLLLAYLLGNDWAFAEFSRLTVERTLGSLKQLAAFDTDERLPLQIYEQMEALRHCLAMNLDSAIHHILKHLALMKVHGSYEESVCIGLRITACYNELYSIGFWPSDSKPEIPKMLAKLEKFTEPVRPNKCAKRRPPTQCAGCQSDFKYEITQAVARMLDSADGLCLKCVQGTKDCPEHLDGAHSTSTRTVTRSVGRTSAHSISA